MRGPAQVFRDYRRDDLHPTRTGIALRLNEWLAQKEATHHLLQENPSVVNFLQCFYNKDHSDPHVVAVCKECSPFPSTIEDPADSYVRISPWMCMAIERARSRRRQ